MNTVFVLMKSLLPRPCAGQVTVPSSQGNGIAVRRGPILRASDLRSTRADGRLAGRLEAILRPGKTHRLNLDQTVSHCPFDLEGKHRSSLPIMKTNHFLPTFLSTLCIARSKQIRIDGRSSGKKQQCKTHRTSALFSTESFPYGKCRIVLSMQA